MIPVISVVGKSDMGKTTLLEKILPELKRRGYKVATIKHDAHSFDIDYPGKDTWRHAQAGADVVIISSSTKLAMIRKVEAERQLDELAALAEAQGVDLVLTEGYKTGNKPKIEVFRKAREQEGLLCSRDELVAIASDVNFELGVPVFGLDDVSGLADLIKKRFLIGNEK